MMNRLYLVRHGENPANLTKEFSHRLIDYSLTPKGVLQAQQTANYFADKSIHEIYSSPLKRAKETAEIIAAACQLPIMVRENFREINVGLLEQRPVTLEKWEQHNRILAAWINGHPEAKFPAGEDYFTLSERLMAGIGEMVQGRMGHNIILVGHGGLFMAAVPELCPDVDVHWLRHQENNNCSISEIELTTVGDDLRGQLIRWAAYDHLSGEAAQLISGLPEPNTFEPTD